LRPPKAWLVLAASAKDVVLGLPLIGAFVCVIAQYTAYTSTTFGYAIAKPFLQTNAVLFSFDGTFAVTLFTFIRLWSAANSGSRGLDTKFQHDLVYSYQA